MIVILIAILSFVLDGALSIYNEINFFYIISFKPLFVVVSLILIYPFFYKKYIAYYKACALIGLLYDLIYTNTIMFYMLIFLLLGFIIHRLYSFFESSFVSGVIFNLIIITIFHVLTYGILLLIGYLSFDLITLSYNFVGVLITNTLFFTIMSLFVKLIKDKKERRDKYSL